MPAKSFIEMGRFTQKRNKSLFTIMTKMVIHFKIEVCVSTRSLVNFKEHLRKYHLGVKLMLEVR